MPQLSVVIITFNEERNIERCLASLRGIADDILVVDSFSTDKTREICERHGVTFIQKQWAGYSPTKNYANTQAKFDWVLSLDADEALSDELRTSILELKNKNEMLTCSFNRLTNYCGTWIRHCGWYPDIKLRIFDRRKTSWHGEIHEELVPGVPVEIRHLKGDCLHYSYYSVDEHYLQAEKFSSLSAKAMFEKGKKISSAGIVLKTLSKFLRNYFLKLGFLDGKAGYTVCRVAAHETKLKYSKLHALLHQKKS
jgi:glycosyltransferase involved in cell wall biosynthesis